MDPVEAFRRAAGPTRTTIEKVPEDAWGRPSPCTEWTVRDVVNHLTSEHLWTPELLAGRRLREVGDRFEGDVVGDDPAGAFGRALTASLAAVEPDDVLDRDVHTSAGVVPAGEYVYEMALDLLVHGWDVAAGVRRTYSPDPELVPVMYALCTEMISDEVRATGIIGPEVPVPRHAPVFDRLLGLLGRDPAWALG